MVKHGKELRRLFDLDCLFLQLTLRFVKFITELVNFDLDLAATVGPRLLLLHVMVLLIKAAEGGLVDHGDIIGDSRSFPILSRSIELACRTTIQDHRMRVLKLSALGSGEARHAAGVIAISHG